MIHHVSIAARDPRHVADVLAELLNGTSCPFPGGIADSFMAVGGDPHGTLIEVYPEDVVLRPGEKDHQQVSADHIDAPHLVPFHFLLSVPVDRDTVQRIGDREGWRTRLFGRGAPGQKPFFHVIEFWIENRLMVELATPDMVGEYTAMFQPGKVEALLQARAAHA